MALRSISISCTRPCSDSICAVAAASSMCSWVFLANLGLQGVLGLGVLAQVGGYLILQRVDVGQGFLEFLTTDAKLLIGGAAFPPALLGRLAQFDQAALRATLRFRVRAGNCRACKPRDQRTADQCCQAGCRQDDHQFV